jgi:hypothetical protein
VSSEQKKQKKIIPLGSIVTQGIEKNYRAVNGVWISNHVGRIGGGDLKSLFSNAIRGDFSNRILQSPNRPEWSPGQAPLFNIWSSNLHELAETGRLIWRRTIATSSQKANVGQLIAQRICLKFPDNCETVIEHQRS